MLQLSEVNMKVKDGREMLTSMKTLLLGLLCSMELPLPQTLQPGLHCTFMPSSDRATNSSGSPSTAQQPRSSCLPQPAGRSCHCRLEP